MMKEIIVGDCILAVCPDFKGAVVYADFVNSSYCAELWKEIELSVSHAARYKAIPYGLEWAGKMSHTRE